AQGDVAMEEESRAGPEDGERKEPGGGSRQVSTQGEHGDESGEGGHDGRNGGGALRHATGRTRREGDTPEEERRLVEVGPVPEMGGKPEPVTQAVLGDERHPRLVLIREIARPERQAVHDGGRGQEADEDGPVAAQYPLPPSAPSAIAAW